MQAALKTGVSADAEVVKYAGKLLSRFEHDLNVIDEVSVPPNSREQHCSCA